MRPEQEAKASPPPGIIEIPFPANCDGKTGRDRRWPTEDNCPVTCHVEKDFPVPVSGFLVDDLSLQRDQFLRINSTKTVAARTHH